ncbi:DUF4304 domain-containing protein [Rhizobium sp. TH2]|uniref:DUF4304 domain-containing protein n=1 Tax=Rhizobium sp. TH2 TaxID=2775403 RepID=UPI002157BD94|nr:DUF4304 domain-containing protein [Rhizobium sp. TH2]UVC09767.1 DUF4304 domain-containing protein [Rhizobium sp. TH2]
MTADRDIVLDAVTEEARANGYKPVGKVYFYKEHPEVICVLNLQRSAWGPQHYLNAGVTFTRLATSKRPKFSGLHILWRADSLVLGERKSALSKALDLEVAMNDAERHRAIREETFRHAFAHLAECANEAKSLELAERIGAAVKQAVFAHKETENADSH